MANSERCGGVCRALALFTAVNAVVPWFLLSGVGRRPSTSLSGLLIAAIPIIGVGVAKLAGDTERLTPTGGRGLPPAAAEPPGCVVAGRAVVLARLMGPWIGRFGSPGSCCLAARGLALAAVVGPFSWVLWFGASWWGCEAGGDAVERAVEAEFEALVAGEVQARAAERHAGQPRGTGPLTRLPPQSFFLISAVFHYLGPSLATLRFARLDVLGVAFLRIASAAVVFAARRRPWRPARRLNARGQATLASLGAVLAAMNTLFYLAVARLPLSTVGAIEFLGTVLLAALGAGNRRNAAALAVTTGGVVALTAIRLSGHPIGFAFAFDNCALFMAYVILGHRIANAAPVGVGRGRGGVPMGGIDQLGASMLVAAVVAAPLGLGGAVPAVSHPVLLLAGAGVGVSSSVIPYVTDQLAMAPLPRVTFALMLALLPMSATLIGAVVLGQIPTPRDLAGIGMVIAGIALHHPSQPGEHVTGHG